MANPWQNCSRLPASAAAVLGALHRSEPDFAALERLREPDWHEALSYCDQSRITLPLRDAARSRMPEWARERVDRNAAANLERLTGIEETYRSLAGWLAEAQLEFVALKGITHAALFDVPAASRVQYDIDLWLPQEMAYAAQAVLAARGYDAMPGMEDYPTDHLPALILKTGWQWRGDFFDSEIPLPVELHFQFWSPDVERVLAPGTDEFWERRGARQAAGIMLGMLHPADALGYAALHLLKHLLRGSVGPFHVLEIACVLESLADNDAFWQEWRRLHPAGLRRLEAVAFCLAREWFGGKAADAVKEEIERLPAPVQLWFQEFATAPAGEGLASNKDELWLHISLVESRRDAWSVIQRRLAPRKLPAVNTTAYLPETEIDWQSRMKRYLTWAGYVADRARHHAVSLPKTALSGARWWWLTNRLGSQFWVFLTAAVIFNFGLFIFVLLYNLFLLDLGFREDFVGVVNAAQRAGGVAGTIPAAWVAHRLGLKKTLMGAIAGVAATEVLRATIGARLPLAALAFASGCIFSVWAVILAPSIAAAVGEKLRTTAFSVFFAVMFAVGIAGNWVGGRLPLWMHGKQPVLLLSAALAAFALIPAAMLRNAPAAPPGERAYPRGKFLWRYLAPFALWHLATGAFNPFNNVYFARLGFAVDKIGSIFSISQLVQVATVLSAPWIIARAGLLRGIVWMMAATSLGLGGLAAQPPGAAAVTAYVAYMSFQWMSEPGLNSLLMNNVAERERSGASALTFLVAFGAQALAAWGAGRMFPSLGYAPVLAGAAVLAVIAAGLFQFLLREAVDSSTENIPA